MKKQEEFTNTQWIGQDLKTIKMLKLKKVPVKSTNLLHLRKTEKNIK